MTETATNLKPNVSGLKVIAHAYGKDTIRALLRSEKGKVMGCRGAFDENTNPAAGGATNKMAPIDLGLVQASRHIIRSQA